MPNHSWCVRLTRAFFAIALGYAAHAPLVAQVPLVSGANSQDFNSIGSGLPSGWSVRTGATASALGTAVALNTANTVSWAATTGQWVNFAASDNNGTPFTGTEAIAAQTAAIDRALGIRQTGAFGDPGASANFNFSTLGLQVTGISFSAQMLSVQTRSTPWLLQYGVGATPVSWTPIGTYNDPGAFGQTIITASGFGTALDNQSNIWLRVVTLTASTGAGSRDSFGIDDFTIVAISGGGPVGPGIVTPPASQTVTEGANVQFTVVASGTAPLSYQWRKGTTNLVDGGIISGALTDTLTLTNVATGDSGNYNVVVTNAVSNATSADAVLTVNPTLIAPGITTQPTPQSVVPGGTATFSVVATGTAPLSYQWRKGVSNLVDGANISGATAATLMITNVSAGDLDNYSVVVSNGVNPPAMSASVALTLSAVITPTGQISYAGGSYTQDFNTLPSTGTFTLTGNGPYALNGAPVLAAGLGGWSFAKYDGTGTVALFRVDGGTSTSGSAYSYGTGTATDRALGTLSSGTTIPRFGVALVNNTGLTVTEFTLSYTGEQWREGGGGVNTLTFEYGLGATDINNGTFTPAPALDFSSPPTAGAGPALDGNFSSNRAAVSGTVSGLSWAPGQTLVLRWSDVNDAGNDDGLAIDDLTLSTPITPADIFPAVSFVAPANATVNVPVNSTVSVSFNEAVNVTGTWFALTGATSGVHTATVSGGPTSFTLTPDTAFSEGETVTLTIFAAQITDQATATRHPSADYESSFITFSSAPFAIHTIQGSGSTSPFATNAVTVQGVVVASFQAAGGIGGYYIETPDAQQDANPATSEGIYVFDNTNVVAVGDLVTVTGTVIEFGAAPNSETEINSLTAFTINSSGNSLPTAVAVTLPFASTGYQERYEGMRVTFPQALTVNDNFDYGHFGEVTLSNGRLSTPTNIVAPGAAAQAQEAANLLNQILLDDGMSVSYPDPTPFLSSADPATATRRAGSTKTTGVTGIIDNRFGTYVLEPTATPTFVEANPRPAAPTSVGSLRVAIGNVENFMNGDGAGGGFPTSRGASSFAEFQRQIPKVTAAILSIAPDIMGLTEVENDRVTNGAPDSYGPTSALAQLVNSLNASAPVGTTYAFVNAAPVDITTDQIHVALIYRVETVEEVGVAAMLNDASFNNLARNPLAQTFRQKSTGGKLTVSINHLRAKGGAAAGAGNNDSGDGQGTNNALRVQEADALTSWLATFPTGDTDPDILIIGDLNAYAKEDPITHILSTGYISQTERFEGEGGYSYAFNGEFGHLDHALATPGLDAQILSAVTWHVNSDEPVYYDYNLENKSAAQQAINAGTPYRYSDHDPVVLGVELNAAPTIITQPASQTATVGDTVSFTVAAIGSPAPSYQWRKDTIDISGNASATTATLTLPNITTADAGSYDVVLSNASGSVTSDGATLSVNKATASVTLGSLAQTYNGSPRVATATTSPAGLNVTFTYDGSSTPPIGAGSYTVVGTIDDVNYIGTATGTLVVAKATATVSLGSLSQTYNGSPKPATYTTTPSGLTATVTYDGSGTAPTNAGSYAVVATITDSNYEGTATGTLVIGKAIATVSLSSLSQTYDGTPKSVTFATTPSGLTVGVTYNGSSTAPTDVGSYAIVATISDTNYAGSTTGTLVISKTSATVTLSDLVQAYDGTPKSATATTSPAGLNVTLTYNGSATPPIYPGNYVVVATINDANLSGSASGTLSITVAALVRHAPSINGGVDGSVQVLLPESVSLNGGTWISGDLLVPGTPNVVLNGHPTYAGTLNGIGSASPTNYQVTLNSAVLRHVVRRADAIAMPTASAPPSPTGTRDVAINNATQSIGSFATLRNLSLNSGAGIRAVPPGTYGTFIANSGTGFVFGVAGSTTPVVYNLQALTLNSSAQVQIVGPVILNIAGSVNINGGTMGASAHPEWLLLKIASGGLTLNGGVTFNGFAIVFAGTITLNGSTTFNGNVMCDRLTINGSAVLNQQD